MVKLLDGPRKEARSKGNKALVSWVGTGAVATLFAVGIGPIAAGVIGTIGAAFSFLLTWKWLRFRGEWGLRF